MKRRPIPITSAALCLFLSLAAGAAETSVAMAFADATGPGAAVGQIRVVESAHGLVFYPQLKGLPPGLHGFHVHENPSCDAAIRDGKPVSALAAGGHFDPKGSKTHGEPWGDGHLGDLPALTVAADGSATQAVLAPRLTLGDVRQRALMIHAGADNYSDQPAALGGGGARLACGVIGG